MAATRMNKNSDTGRERAVSEVIGAIMLISVVVVAVAIVGVVLTSQGTPQKIPALDAVISNYGSTIQIYHNGGDTLQKAEMAILVDGTETAFNKSTNPSWTSWSAGESLVYVVPDTQEMPTLVKIVYKGSGSPTVLISADFSATGMINPSPTPTAVPGPVVTGFTGTPISGNAPLTVAFSDTSTGSPISWSWTFGDGGTATVQNPTHIYTIAGTYSPSLTVSNGTGSDTLTRTNYITVSPAGPTANFVGNPQAGSVPLTVYFTDLSTGTTTSWLWEFGDGATDTSQHPSHVYPITGLYTVNLTATNAGGSNKTSKAGYISTSLSAPTITAISPNLSLQTTPVSVTVAGTGFLSGANVTLVKAGQTDLIASSVNVVSGNLITCQFNLATVAVGPWDVKVTNTNGQSGTLAGGFTVKNPIPTVSGITPATGARGWSVSITNLAGSNFKTGADVRLVNNTAGPDIIATNVVVNGPGTSITCTFNLLDAPVPRRNVTVTNPYSDTGTLLNGFTITSNAPTITSSTPATGAQAATVSITNLAGTGFQPGATAVYWQGAYSIPLTGVNVVSAIRITGTLVIPSLAPAGAYNITVTNTDGRSGTRTSGFTVTSNAPTVTAITPNTYVRGWTVSITNLAGTNFQNGATVKLVNASAGPDITATNVVVVSANQITCTFDLTGAPAARRNVTVTNPDGKTGTLANGFTITSNTPTLTARNPTTGNRGWPVNIISLTGTGFQPGADVRLRRAGYSDIIATGVNVASPTSINAGTFNLLGVTAGTWNILVINTDGQSSGTLTFTVSSPAPTIPAAPLFSPATGARGTVGLVVTAPGTGLQPGMAVTLTLAPTTITAYNVNVVSPTQVIFTIDIPAGATTGAYTARYTNTDGGTNTRASRFTVT